MDYPNVKFQCAKTFWTKCLNLFETKKCQNRFCLKLQLCPLVDMCSFCNISTIWWWHNYSSLIHNPQSWLLGHFSGLLSPRTSIRKLSRIQPSRNFPANRQLSRPSGNFPDHQEVFKPSRNFPNHLETFQTIRQLFRPSGNFSNHTYSFQNIQQFSRPFRNFPVHF